MPWAAFEHLAGGSGGSRDAHGGRGCTAEGFATTDTLKNELERKWLLSSQAALKSSNGEFDHLCFQIFIERNGSNLKLLFSYFSK